MLPGRPTSFTWSNACADASKSHTTFDYPLDHTKRPRAATSVSTSLRNNSSHFNCPSQRNRFVTRAQSAYRGSSRRSSTRRHGTSCPDNNVLGNSYANRLAASLSSRRSRDLRNSLRIPMGLHRWLGLIPSFDPDRDRLLLSCQLHQRLAHLVPGTSGRPILAANFFRCRSPRPIVRHRNH